MYAGLLCAYHNLHVEDFKETGQPVAVSAGTLISRGNTLYPISSSVPVKLHPNRRGYINSIVLV